MRSVLVREYEAPPIDRREILRYAGATESSPEVEALLDACISEVGDRLSYRVCFGEYPASVKGDTVTLGEMQTRSAHLARRLAGCDGAILFAATVGHTPDRLIARYGSVSPARALMHQAIGTERIEALCDLFEGEIREEKARQGVSVARRYSPGYGDLSLEIQREIFAHVDCAKRIGVTLNESLLMSPSKSVTAIIGIGKKE